MNIAEAVEEVVRHAADGGIIEDADRRWAFNRILSAIGETGCERDLGFGARRQEDARMATAASMDGLAEAPGTAAAAPAEAEAAPGEAFHDALDQLATHMLMRGLAADAESASSRIMGAIMPRPSEVARRFGGLLSTDPRAATDYLYALSTGSDYVKTRAIARNLKWETPTRWGDLEITINLSKPEKDPRAIASAASTPLDAYPACQLCMENEGYAGRGGSSGFGSHPARPDLRIAPIELLGERWGLQYSPYAYYGEHCIAMSAEHRPMRVDRSCFERLLELVGMFPHYFFGSNADLPIVGGSILSHDHFQGGAHEFPMELAEDAADVGLAGFPDVRARTIEWPVSVLRLTAGDPARLADAADAVLQAWIGHDDHEAGIVSHTGPVRHNTVTPIARRRGEAFELDLALRCNIATEEHPLGVFHPHEGLHHIKKENIGLIEVMGLAILPARLARELAAVEALLVGGAADAVEFSCDPLAAPHAEWAAGIAQRHRGFSSSGEAADALRDEVGAVFAQVLEDAGVFKPTAEGDAARDRFLARL